VGTLGVGDIDGDMRAREDNVTEFDKRRNLFRSGGIARNIRVGLETRWWYSGFGNDRTGLCYLSLHVFRLDLFES
jgi:hypothetical protein